MPRPAAFRLLLPLVLLAAGAGPAAAWSLWDHGHQLRGMGERIDWDQPGIQHRLDGRFGVIHFRDSATGQSRTEPLAQMRYTLGLVQQTDSGFRWSVSVSVEASNLGRDIRRPSTLLSR